jgi:hypothetical protein
MDIPGGQVGAGTAALILVFACVIPGCGRERGMRADACLDAGFLVGRQHKIAVAQRRGLPATLLEVKHPTGLGGELRIAREEPASVSPRAKRIAAEPAPQRGTTDFSHNALGQHLMLDVSQRPARQTQTAAEGQFARERLNLDDDAGEKSGPAPRRVALPQGRGSQVRRNAFAICSRFGAAYPGGTDDVVGQTLRCHEYDLGPNHISIRDVYFRALVSSSRRSSADGAISYGLILGIPACHLHRRSR